MTTTGRNEPCPCGSGKKYKKCCMDKDTAVDLKEFRENRAEEDLRGEILRFATGTRFKDEIVEDVGLSVRDVVNLRIGNDDDARNAPAQIQ